MKNLFRLITVASVLGGGFLFAAEADAAKDAKASTEKPAHAKGAPAEENLTPEQREARRKEMAAKRAAKLKELKEKKTAGTLSEKEQKQLERLEKGGRPGGPGGAKKKADKAEATK